MADTSKVAWEEPPSPMSPMSPTRSEGRDSIASSWDIRMFWDRAASASGSEKKEPMPWKIIIFTLNLLVGLVLSQVLALTMDSDIYHTWAKFVAVTTMCCLSFIMINVGYEFNIDKSQMRMYAKDYLVAMTAAGFPWVFVALWFMFALPVPLPWKEALLAARFSAPTSAGILFSMLEGAGPFIQ